MQSTSVSVRSDLDYEAYLRRKGLEWVKMLKESQIDRDYEAYRQRGREVALNGPEAFDHSLEQMGPLLEHWYSTRAEIAWRGCCERCPSSNDWVTASGEIVCRHSGQVCPRVALVDVVNLLGKVNS